MNSKHGASIKTELEIETFKPNLREASDLLEADQIEKVRSLLQTVLMENKLSCINASNFLFCDFKVWPLILSSVPLNAVFLPTIMTYG